MCRRNIDINEADSDGFTPLMEAAMNNHIFILSLLLDKGADINLVNRIGRNALIEAAARGHPAITLRLCQAHPNLDYRNEQHPLRLSALMEAASRGHDGVVFWLCEARASVDLRNKWGDTALIMAANNNRLGSVLILLINRADTKLTGDAGLTALETARIQGHTRIVEVLSDPKILDPKHLQTLYQTFKAQQKDLLQEEVNYDASVSSRKLPRVDVAGDNLDWEWEENLELIPHRHIEQQYTVSQLKEQIAVSSKKSRLFVTPGLRKPYVGYQNQTRLFPLHEMPKFGEAVWIAVEPTRISRKSKTEKVKLHNHVVSLPNMASEYEQEFPVLRIKDDGTWTYAGDVLSGELSGTFEMFNIMTVPSESAITSAAKLTDVTPCNLSGDDINRYFYLIRLTAPPIAAAATSELQIVSFILGKQIVLGRLVMEMNDNILPWWI